MKADPISEPRKTGEAASIDSMAQVPADERLAVAESPESPTNVSSEHASNIVPSCGFQNLDVRFVGLTRFVNIAIFTLLGTIALAAGCLLLWAIPFPWKLLVPLGWFVLATLFTLGVVWWPRWEHDGWSYRLDQQVVELRFGVVWHVTVLIPVSRLQHVDLHVGPLERKWGLASLEIHTAGTRSASHKIPGLDLAVAHDLRDQLIVATNRETHARSND